MQTGRTKHIRAKHNKNELQSLLSVSKIPRLPRAQASVSSSDASMAIDSDRHGQDLDADMPDVPCTPHLTSHFGSLPVDGTNIAQARSPIPSNNDPTSPLPFQPEFENHHASDQAEQNFASSTKYHPFINGMT